MVPLEGRRRRHAGAILRLLAAAWSQAPESVAYGLLALAPMGPAMAARAMAMALVGAVLANIVIALAGAGRLVTAPRAALALLTSGLVGTLVAHPSANGPLAPAVILGLVAVGLVVAGALQMLFGALRIGNIVKFTPHPVRSGLMSAVGVLLLIGALPTALGWGFGHGLADALAHPQPAAMLVAAVAIAVTWFSARRFPLIPPTLPGLVASSAVQAAMQALGIAVGPLIGVPALARPWFAELPDAGWLLALPAQQALWLPVFVFAATVAMLGALDTLLVTSIVDGRTRSVRDANRELRAQGLANVLSGLAGGLPNSPSVLRSLALVDVSPGGRRSVLGYAAALAVVLAFPQVLGWLPVSAIGGVLLLQGVQIVDPWMWRIPALLRRNGPPGAPAYDRGQRRLLRDNWIVSFTVVATSLALGLAAAVAVGAALAVLLFVRANMRQVVRSQRSGEQRRSMKIRSPQASATLQREGAAIRILELQGALFFGTADTVRASLDRLPSTVNTVVLDLYLVGEIDATGARILLELAEDWARQGRHVVGAEWALDDPRRGVVDAIARSAGLPPMDFGSDVDQALEAAEDRLLARAALPEAQHQAIELGQTLLAQGLDAAELQLLRQELQVERLEAGMLLFRQGDLADGFYLTVQGDLGIRLPGSRRRLVSFAPGTMVGEMAALSRGHRSADAVAETPLTVLRLHVDSLERFRREHPALAAKLLHNIALHMGNRLRELTQDLSTWVARTGLPTIPNALGTEPAPGADRGERI